MHFSSGTTLTITTHPEDQEATTGYFVNFTCEASGSPSINYTWFHNNVETGPGTNTLTIIASYSSFGTYHCVASSGAEEVTSNSATLTGMYVLCHLHYCVIL